MLKVRNFLIPFFLSLICMTNNASAALAFSDLTVTENSFSLSMSGTMPAFPDGHTTNVFDVQNPDLFSNPGWVTYPDFLQYTTKSWTGSRRLANVNIGSEAYGDYIYFYFGGDFSPGEAIDGTITATWSEIVFDPGAIDQLEIYADGLSYRSLLLGSAALSEVPIPSAAWLLGTSLIALFGIKRQANSPRKVHD